MTFVKFRLKAYYQARPLMVLTLAYLVAITAAESLVAFADPRLGVLSHCAILLALLFSSTRVTTPQERSFLVGLTFAPLISIINLALSPIELPMLIVPIGGLFLGWTLQRTGSHGAVTLAQGLANCTLFLVMPFLMLKSIALPSQPHAFSVQNASTLLQGLGLFVSLSLVVWVLIARSRRLSQFAARLTGYAALPPAHGYAVAQGTYGHLESNRARRLLGMATDATPPQEKTSLAARLTKAALRPVRWLSDIGPGPSPQPVLRPTQTHRMLVAALLLVGLRVVRLLWPDPHLAGALTVAEPLLVVWPFVTPVIPPPYADYLVGGAFYVLLLLFGAAWRVSERSAAYAIPFDPTIIWMALTIGAALIGQLLLGKQRLVLLRVALLLLASGAVLAAFEFEDSAGVIVLLGALLVFAEYFIVLRTAPAEEKPSPMSTPAAKDTPRREPVSPPDDALEAAATLSAPARYFFEKRQLLSMRLASIVAYDAPAMPELLREMLQTFTSIAPAEFAIIFLVHDEPEPGLVLASSYDAPNSSSAMRPVALDETEAPWVFNALRRDQTLVYGQSQWGDDPLLDTLHQALGTSELYPTVLQPITRGEWAHGLLVAQNPYGNEAFSEDEIRLCQVTATRLGAAIARFDGLSGFPLVPGDSETDAESSAAGTAAATSASPATI